MATRTIKAGTANQIITVTMRDSTTGALKTGLAFGDVTYSYTREGDNARANGTCADATLDAYTSTGWKLISDANQPGKYQFGIPSGMIAAGAIKATVAFSAAGCVDQVEHVLLTAVDLQDAVRIGATALPNAAADAAGGLPISDAGGLDMDGIAAAAGTAAATDILVTPANKLSTDASGKAAATVAAGDIANNALTAAALATDAVNEIASGLLDTVNTSGAHNVANSVGRQIRSGSGTAVVTIRSGTAQSGSTSNTIKLDASASATNNIYNGATVVLTGGVGVGQTRRIVSYNGTTKVATVDKTWAVTPNNTTTFDIVAGTTSIVAAEGLAQGGAASAITLATTASTNDDIYNGSLITIESGTGAGQTEVITDYTGTSREASIAPATWSVQPSTDSVYAVIPAGDTVSDGGATEVPTASEIAATVWTYDPRTLTQEAAAVTAAVTGSAITIRRGDTVTITLTGMGSIAGRTKLWFGLKTSLDDGDNDALMLVEETAGLYVLNGKFNPVAANATIVVSDEAAGDLTITLLAGATKELAAATGLFYDLQWKNAGGSVLTLTAASASVTGDVVRAVG